MQLVDNSAAADFVLVDDSDAVNTCTGATAIKSIHLDPAAANADLTVSLSRAPAAYKISTCARPVSRNRTPTRCSR